MSEIAILEAFEGMPDQRRGQGKRHSLQLCLALFTLGVAAGNQGFEAFLRLVKELLRRINTTFSS